MTCLKNVLTDEVIRLTEAEAAALLASLLASQLKVWLPCGRCEWVGKRRP